MHRTHHLALAMAGIAVGILWLVGALPPANVQALSTQSLRVASGTLSNIAVSLSDKTTAASSVTYTLTFTNQTEIPADSGRINIGFFGPYGYTSNTSKQGYPDFNNATVKSTTSPNTLTKYSTSWNGMTLKTSAKIAANTSISVVLEGVKNPTQAGYMIAQVSTSDFSTNLDGTSDWGGDFKTSFIEIGTNTNLKGKITEADGITGVSFASVSLWDSSNNRNFYTYADKNGDYGIGDVPASSYQFNLNSPPSYGTGKTYFAPATETLTVAASGTTTKNASFRATTKKISGKVTKNSTSGAAVADARVYFSQSGSSSYGWAEARTDSSGNYSAQLTGGTWTLSIYPDYSETSNPDWTYEGGYGETISFVNDATTETKTKDFTVTSFTSTIKGKITKADGSAITQYGAGISLQNSKGSWFSASLDSTGAFSSKVTPSTYTLTGWSSDQNFSFPKIDNFTVADGETKDLGTIKLVEKTDTISGKVSDDKGNSVSGASISAWKNEGGYDYGYTTSAKDGTYSIKVTPGTWQISAWPQWDSGFVSPSSNKPQSVTVTKGTPATINFTFQKSTATINGTITDPDGNVLSSVSSWVNADDGSKSYSGIGTSVTNGAFSLKVPAGTWNISLSLWGTDFSSPDPVKVTVADNETKAITMKAVANNVTVSGTVKDDKGDAIKNTWVSIWATKGQYGSWQQASFDTAAGTYTLKLAAGTWNLGWWVDQNLGFYSVAGEDAQLTLAANDKKTYDIVLKKADSTISGKATKADGSAMQWAWITADSRDVNEKTSSDTKYYSNGASSNNAGEYTLKVPASTYFVGANMWPGSGVINPKRQKVTVSSDKPATVNLTFLAADASISGTVKQDDKGTDAFVTAWSEDGGYVEANANNAGAYAISVSKGSKWHVRAIKESGKDVYKSKEEIIDLSGTDKAVQDLILVKQKFTLPDSTSLTFDPTKQQTINLEDGAVLSIPANSVATGGTVTITAEAEADLAEEADAKPLKYGYELNAANTEGTAITKFTTPITVEMPYTADDLSSNKILTENEIRIAYYDESAGTWIELNACTVNEDANSVTCQTDHFTRFALVAAQDTTPPSAPTNTKATSGAGTVDLSWTNPTTDFASITIYRSTTKDKLGDKVFTGITSTSKQDTGLTNGTTYFYTVRAVDASGNESTNTSQVESTPNAAGTQTTTTAGGGSAGTTLPKTGQQPSLGWLVALGLAIVFSLTVMGQLRRRRVRA